MSPARLTGGREMLARLALIVGSAVACLAALEGFFRLADPQVTSYTGRGLYMPDFELGHVLQPNLDRGDIRTNSFGFRDREYAVAKPPGAFRIVGIGDSFTFGAESAKGIYLEVLEETFRLSGLGFPVEVINTGVPAYSTVQEIGHLKRFGIRFQPDLVILGLFPTGDIVENRSDEHLEVVAGELTSRPVSRWQRWLLRSHLYRWLRARSIAHAEASPVRTPGRESFLSVEFERLAVCRIRPRRYIQESYEITKALLLGLRDYLEARNVALVVLLIPDEVQVSPVLLDEVLAAKGGRGSDYDLDLPTRTFREFCQRQGIDVVDVLEECRRQGRMEPVYRSQDTHWNEAGHAIAARKLYDRLTQRFPRLRPTDAGPPGSPTPGRAR